MNAQEALRKLNYLSEFIRTLETLEHARTMWGTASYNLLKTLTLVLNAQGHRNLELHLVWVLLVLQVEVGGQVRHEDRFLRVLLDYFENLLIDGHLVLLPLVGQLVVDSSLREDARLAFGGLRAAHLLLDRSLEVRVVDLGRHVHAAQVQLGRCDDGELLVYSSQR